MIKWAILAVALLAVAEMATAQANYQVVSLHGAGTISGTVKWSGPVPHIPSLPIKLRPGGQVAATA